MRSAAVREAWEFYRDNCPGFKEQMRKEFRRLDEHVASLESENAELRELVRKMVYAISPTSREHMLVNLAELGIEVKE